MATFEWIIVLLLGAALLAALARKVGAPYPTFLALGGVLLAFVPASPNWTLDPQLALALFMAPVLLDAAYDSSLRDLRANWRPPWARPCWRWRSWHAGSCPACRGRWRSRWAQSSPCRTRPRPRP
jgi:hypothetical protein